MSTADATSPAADANDRLRHKPRLFAVVLTPATFTKILDTTIANVVPPDIAASPSSSNNEATWVDAPSGLQRLTIFGRLGDLLGGKRYFTTCTGGLTVCSLICGTSGRLVELVIFPLAPRFFQRRQAQQSIILDIFGPARHNVGSGPPRLPPSLLRH